MLSANRIRKGEYIVSFPLERSCFYAIGSAIRRIILSSTPGKCIVGVSFDCVNHEYEASSSIKEDILDVLRSLQSISFITEEKQKEVTITVKGPCKITSKVFEQQCVNLSVSDPDIFIATVVEKKTFKLHCVIQEGFGIYLGKQDMLSSVVSFNPVSNISFKYDDPNICFFVKVNGDIDPSFAFYRAFKIIKDSVDSIVFNLDHSNKQIIMNLEIANLDIPSRIINILHKYDICLVSDIVKMSKKQLLDLPNFGQNSLDYVIQALNKLDLTLIDNTTCTVEEKNIQK